ncbi:MAG TPA: pyridoxamine 5'-phosphate oxidase family protein [Gordonia sp. (in: high G+C Gram-positive bacteria)]|uniref:pyridoxamine 5'-phosphate oxidase family protein n=1 Tax=unclassified Gordonia (in: high G+C Gram-positive bacteria) TaxID=2657482 RepID=UPI000F9B9C15|nr:MULTISPECIES: pyridoxamine 5'-phosphate oxidase family protein [unclassified Gordonia (in: high G+C Gram-positive bacteria)]RUP38461.1 MAG: hypothetical protein EKK60_09825 [Gordonia sp. (in: high G+C Gram-positive bacteria)]HNP58252.1 pyridoxamine 5'-phosphate oxidase family protein [Gordonia sp. (in: high G+C Gram-positive bacteria)]HRC52099.1 pyridoxamine 5'-phosphate oxidase family protein [Gordonia sp. (in: high G+C Gram-positive bacteria)]
MRLPDAQAWERLAASDHGVLATVHPRRGVDAVPVVYAVDDGHVGIPVDRVKPKESTRLQRERNLEADPRATLLVDHWDPVDWAQLWWVRTELRRVDSAERAGRLGELLEERYPQYTGQPFEKVLVLRIERVTGWQASES